MKNIQFRCLRFCLGLSIILVTGCDTSEPSDPTLDPPRALSADETALVEGDNAFGFDLFKRLHEDKPSENLFISPTSVSMALGMTLNGADGTTRDQMVALLHKRGLSEETINASYRSLIDLLTNLDPEVTLQIANSIWYREGFDVESDFLEKNQSFFDAEISALDFADAASVDVINGWVEDKTSGLIDSIIQEIGADVVMYLINAIYFNGRWTYQFDADLTTDETFFNADETQATVPLMRLKGPLRYAELPIGKMIDLPYGDSLYSMTLILPRVDRSIDSLVNQLNPQTWDSWTESLVLEDVTVELPRFELEYKKELREVLQALGMTDAFDPSRADLSRINPLKQLFISKVLHKTVLKVDEEGTEAAAVTAIVVETTALPEPLIFRADRPFLLMIRERHTGSILFAGKVMQL